MSDPNFNINLQVDKVMDKISESKALRKWTYAILVLICLLALIWKSNELVAGIADLIRAMNGR